MSMISSLIDELNKSADEWNGSNMFELARMCREAADTITELRGALQVASVDYRHLQDENARLRSCLSDDAENARMIMAENAKLREQIHWLKQGDILHVLTDQEYIDQCERERLMQVSIDALDKENAKLRELVRDVVLLAGLNGRDVTKMQMHAHGGDWRTVWERMSELGVPGTGVDHD